MISLSKALNFLTDKRVFPLAFKSLMTDRLAISYPNISDNSLMPLDVMLTVDVENTVTNSTSRIVEQTQEIANLFDKQKIHGTFFIQGTIVSSLSKQLRLMANRGHEIGLHGYTHDNWGSEKWFLNDKILSGSEKRRYLQIAVNEFVKYKLPSPGSFRAPNLSINEETLILLKETGFSVDSSYPSYLGGGAKKIVNQHGFWSIPVSSPSVPKINFNGLFPFLSYEMLTLENIIKWDEQKLKKTGDQMIFEQKKNGIKPCLVILCHNWEFNSNDKYDYSSADNIKKMQHFLTVLQKTYECNFPTLSQYAAKL